MLAADAARKAADLLKHPPAFPARLIVYPDLYGKGTTPTVSDLAANTPNGWAAILVPRALGDRESGLFGGWVVTVQVMAPRGRDLLPLARAVIHRLKHTARRPTGFVYEGDTASGLTAEVQALNLTFVATLRHQE